MLTALNEALPGTKGDNLAGSWSSRIIHTAISKHLHFSSSFKCQALTHLAFYVLMCLSEAILQLNSCSGWVVKKKKKASKCFFSLKFKFISKNLQLKRSRIFVLGCVQRGKSGGPGHFLGSHLCTKGKLALRFWGSSRFVWIFLDCWKMKWEDHSWKESWRGSSNPSRAMAGTPHRPRLLHKSK